VRSEKAARFLLSNQFSDVTNMAEGMKGWLQRGLPAVTT
jgi:rhodanese-related sulfurtransferase